MWRDGSKERETTPGRSPSACSSACSCSGEAQEAAADAEDTLRGRRCAGGADVRGGLHQEPSRELLYKDMVARWVTDLPEATKRFYYIATVCDPRQKGLRIPGVSADDRERALDWFEAEYTSFYAGDDVACAGAPAAAPAAAGRSKSSLPAHSQYAGSSFIDFMANLASVAGDTTTVADGEGEEGAIENEARRYLDLPDAPMATDILDWWAKHQTTFPNLSVMAQQYLGVPATSASAERLFSIAGRVFSDLRQGMGDDHLEALMWARINREGRLGA